MGRLYEYLKTAKVVSAYKKKNALKKYFQTRKHFDRTFSKYQCGFRKGHSP